jgi:hypothetical protein
MAPKVPTVDVVKTTNLLASQDSVNLKTLPPNAVVDTVKTANSLMSQYSVEVIDPAILALMRHRLENPGAENSICTEIVCPSCRPSTEIIGIINT